MSEEKLKNLEKEISELEKRFDNECSSISSEIYDKKSTLRGLQTKKEKEKTDDLKRRSKVKRLLNLKNIDFENIDMPIYRDVYNQYGITTPRKDHIILFNQIDVNKVNKKTQTISNKIRKITIVYNLNTDIFTVYIHRMKNYNVILEYQSLMETIEQGITRRDTDKPNSFIINISEQTSNIPLMTHEEKENTYYTDQFNVSKFCSNIKGIFTRLKNRETEFKGKISTIDEIIKNFVTNNQEYINKNEKYINTNDTDYLIQDSFNNILIKEVSWVHITINRFFDKGAFDNYDILLTVPSPVQYYIKMMIAQTLFSDLPSNFNYKDKEDKKKRLTDYDSNQVKQLIAKPDYSFDQRFDQRELIFTGKVNDGQESEKIDAILISSYQDNDELYIVDHKLNVYTLVDSEKLLEAVTAEAVAEPVAEPAGGKRSRRKRRKISKKKKIKTRIRKIKTINKKKKIKTRIKKKTRKRVETHKR